MTPSPTGPERAWPLGMLAAAAAGMAKPGDADLGGKAGLKVAAIGLTGMAPSTVFVGADEEPLGPSPIWQDMRARDEVPQFCAAARPNSCAGPQG